VLVLPDFNLQVPVGGYIQIKNELNVKKSKPGKYPHMLLCISLDLCT
jgi:hypothetical protein